MILRIAALADAQELSNLAQDVFAETYGTQLSTKVLHEHLTRHLSPTTLLQELSESKAIYLIAEIKNSLAGLVKLEPAPSPAKAQANAVEMVKCYVRSEYRGGLVAKALMQMSLNWAVAEGFDTMWLLVWKQNPRAVRFYKKHGFEVVGTQQVWVGTVAFEDHVMQKELR